MTVRPAEVNGLRPVQLIKIVAHELAAFVEGVSPTEDAGESLAVLGAAPGVPAVLHVDRRRLEAWSLGVGDARGIACRNGDRAMMWLGVGGKVPTLIFTEDLADALRRLSPAKMVE